MKSFLLVVRAGMMIVENLSHIVGLKKLFAIQKLNLTKIIKINDSLLKT